MAGKDRCGHKIRSGCTNPAFLGAKENAQKKLSILSTNTWVTNSASPFKRGTQFFQFGLYDGPDLSTILAPGERGGGGSGPAPGRPPWDEVLISGLGGGVQFGARVQKCITRCVAIVQRHCYRRDQMKPCCTQFLCVVHQQFHCGCVWTSALLVFGLIAIRLLNMRCRHWSKRNCIIEGDRTSVTHPHTVPKRMWQTSGPVHVPGHGAVHVPGHGKVYGVCIAPCPGTCNAPGTDQWTCPCNGPCTARAHGPVHRRCMGQCMGKCKGQCLA